MERASSPGPAPELPQSVFAERRRRLLDRLGDGVALIPAGPELLKSRDTEIVFRQSSDLHYLTGYPEPEAVAVVSPHTEGGELTLFVRPRAPEAEAWTGPRLGVDLAAEKFGAVTAYPITELPDRLPELLRDADRIHLPLGEVALLDDLVYDAIRTARRTRPRSGRGPMGIVDLEVLTGELRLIKDEHELGRMRTAAAISAKGHLAAMRRTAPDLGEWEIQAELERVFRERGASFPAFPSIVGSGPNATVLHYVDNNRTARDGELLLIDAGAEWGMYCADITRTFPVSGRFTSEQRDLYEVVLAAEEAAIAAAVPGAPFTAVHDAAVRALVRGLLDLEILPIGDSDAVIESGAYRRFYLHQTSHWLGLDVHDAGPYRRDGDPVVLEPGMVLTVEPGIYIPSDTADVPENFRGIGIRIEDNVVITVTGNEVITRGVPVAPDEIEAVMAVR